MLKLWNIPMLIGQVLPRNRGLALVIASSLVVI